MAALFRAFCTVKFTENTLTITAILFKIYKDYKGGEGGSAMKFFRCLFKLIVAFLAICGAFYIFSEIVENINLNDSEDDSSGKVSFSKKVIKAADKQIRRTNTKSEEQA